MLNWAKQTVGITEPIHGPSAVHPVSEQLTDTTHTLSTREDLKWALPDSTCVETHTFYMVSKTGRLGLLSVIYSNVMNMRTTAQFSAKIFAEGNEGKTPHMWSTENLSNFDFPGGAMDFVGEGSAGKCEVRISDKGDAYTVKSGVDKNCKVDVTFRQAAPGFVAGRDGTTTYGTDAKQPWGRMRHVFWPRCVVEGSIMTKDGAVEFGGGQGMFVHALQGMKPHFAAAKWNFANFQSPTYSATLMNYTTPPSYGETQVTVGGLAIDGAILFANAAPHTAVTHTTIQGDPDNSWPEPSAAAFTWSGTTADGKPAKAVLEGAITPRVDRVDVMGELPKFVKQIVAGASGAKPYIYQYTPKMTLRVDVDGKETTEEGRLFMEATFIS